jgi:hypothetical protein
LSRKQELLQKQELQQKIGTSVEIETTAAEKKTTAVDQRIVKLQWNLQKMMDLWLTGRNNNCEKVGNWNLYAQDK